MFEATFNEQVTVRRAVSRDARNKTSYEQVLDAGGGPLYLKCRIERTRRRIFDLAGVQTESDASMLFRDDLAPQIAPEDLIVTSAKETFKVLIKAAATSLFGGAKYARAELRETRTSVPEDVHG